MPRNRSKQLVVFDLDNTLTDTLKCWGASTAAVVTMLQESFGIEEQPIVDAIRRAPTQYRFSDFSGLIDWLDDEGILPLAESPSRQYAKNITKQYLCNVWRQHQKAWTFFYDDTIATLQNIRAQKTSMALYTDSDAPSMIARMWLLARSATAKGALADETALAEMFSHYYCQPSIKDDHDVLKYIDPDFVHIMKRNMTLWQDRVYKPSTDHLLTILEDFKTEPEYALMVGDTAKDGGCARPLSIDFAWCRFGANIDADTVATAKRIASPIFQYGLQAVTDCFNARSAPSKTLRKSLAELKRHYHFVPGQAFSDADHSGRSSPAYPRNDADPVGKIPPLKRVWPPSHVHTRDMPLGPATHLPPTPTPPAPANSNDTADQEKPDQPKKPQPV